ncbi:MAG: nucleotide exchange factor GrpE [Nitrospiraceae bacterium]
MKKNKENNSDINELGDDDSGDSGQLPVETGERAEGDDSEPVLTENTEDAAALQDRYLRLAAEFENYKRLARKDQRDFTRFANENILKELLPVLDNLERAIQHGKASQRGDGLTEGVELTLKQLLETLTKFGVRQIASVGQPFDPSYHQAVGRVESTTVPGNSVVEEYEKGYLLHDRVIRPAMVVVAVSAGGSSEEASASSSEAPVDAQTS